MFRYGKIFKSNTNLNPIAITFTSCLNLSNTLPYKHKSNQFNKIRKILLNQNCLQSNTNC